MRLAMLLLLALASAVGTVVPPPPSVPQDPLLVDAYFSEHGHALLELWGNMRYTEDGVSVTAEELAANVQAGYDRIVALFDAEQKVTLLTSLYERAVA